MIENGERISPSDSSVAEFILSQILRSLHSLRMTRAKGSFGMTKAKGSLRMTWGGSEIATALRASQ
jgi:hypothetical protein